MPELKNSFKAKILFVIDSLRFGGAERQLVELIKGLSKRDDYQVHLVVLLQNTSSYEDILKGYGVTPVYYIRRNKYGFWEPLAKIIRYVRSQQIDILHGFMNMGSLMAVLAGKMTGRPVVSSVIRDAKDTNLKVKYTKRFIACLSDIVVANSKAGFANRFKRIKSNYRIVYNGLDMDRFSRLCDKAAFRQEFNFKEDKKVILCVASLSKNKDHETLLNAFTKVHTSDQSTVLLLVGDGPERKTLENRVSALKLQNSVRFCGYRTDVDYIYEIANIVVLSTNCKNIQEGIANSLIEAMACQIPVIANYGGGTDEFICNGENGILVEPHNPALLADAILLILNDNVLASSIAVEGKRTVENLFALEVYVNNYGAIYQELVRSITDE